MAICKCKMCGGDLSITELDKIAVCDYCGTKQTVPSADSEKKLALFNRANRLRLNSEFDKAASLYEQIVAEFPEEAEAYWGLCLCNYGIEYVDDPATGAKKPTCHRASFEKLSADENFSLAMEYADISAQRQYREEAREIDRINEEILSISKNESPYDIFICYKETDASGGRTPDSVLAQDMYDALTAKGYKVFFSRISLEDKLGLQYEPYIFAALNSAKIMLSVGTQYEYFHAVWVKNEWGRFVRLAAKDKSKILIPCYKDMDPYDMPDEFKGLQAQDMGKLGAMQDLLRGIEKILPKNKPAAPAAAHAQAVAANPAAATTDSLLDRAFLFLEDGEWESANEYAEKVLDIDPRNADAYLAKLMAELNVRKREELQNCEQPFDGSNRYQKALRFGNEALQKELRGYIEHINTRNENERIKRERQAEEQRRIAEEKPRSVAQALKEGVCSKGIYSNAERLAAAKTRVGYLERIRSGFGEMQVQFGVLQGELNGIVLREKQLTAQRSKLGMFAGNEKKRIDEELASLSQKKSSLTERIGQLDKTVGRYETEADLAREIEEARRTVSELEAQPESERGKKNETLSYAKALDIYLRDPEIAEAVNAVYPTAALHPAMRGKTDSLCFGKYVQTKAGEPEPIEWQVLARENGRMLLISKYALDCQKYHTESTKNVTWETCSLRKWLNGAFINAAFGSEERNRIVSSVVTADKNPIYRITPGNNTRDKVFLLSITQAKEYFKSDKNRKCAPTVYAIAQGAQTNDPYHLGGITSCQWWLRSPGCNSDHAALVSDDGSVFSSGSIVSSSGIAVRPALWINLDP